MHVEFLLDVQFAFTNNIEVLYETLHETTENPCVAGSIPA